MDVTALIPTWNAAKTVVRAIESALPQVAEIIVFDDGSADETVALIKNLRNPKIRIYGLKENRGVWFARSQCLAFCRTPWAAWLDADDEFLPDRIEELSEVMQSGEYGWVYDNMEFYDGASLEQRGRTWYPEKLNDGDYIFFQFARNFIRGACQALVDVEEARKIGYNALINDSDYDHMLRAILYSDKRVYFHHTMTYRYYITAGSVSSYKERQIQATRWILNNIGFDVLKARLDSSSLDVDECLFIGLYFLANISAWKKMQELLENEAHFGGEHDWFYHFMWGVAASKLADFDTAKTQFEAAIAIASKPECLNNLAVVYANLGQTNKHLLQAALKLFPDYLDARTNMQAAQASALTIVPLRVEGELPWSKPELAKKYNVL